MPTSDWSGVNAPAHAAAHRPALKPAKIPTPPKLGVGASCQRSDEGTATNRPRTGDRRSAQITAAATGRASIATVVLTEAEGSRMPLAPCEDATPRSGRKSRVLQGHVRGRSPVDAGRTGCRYGG